MWAFVTQKLPNKGRFLFRFSASLLSTPLVAIPQTVVSNCLTKSCALATVSRRIDFSKNICYLYLLSTVRPSSHTVASLPFQPQHHLLNGRLMKVNLYLVGGTLVAALGGLLFGFDTAVISGTTDALTKVFHLQGTFLGVEGFWLGLTVASALVGTIIGAVAAGKPADFYGRRETLMVIALLYLVSAIGCALPWNWSSFLLFRFVGGLGIGGASVLSPLYIAEISPARYRGRLVTITQLNIVFGMLLAFFSNWFITQLHLGASEWRWMFGVAAFPSALFFVLLFFTPLSPRWLVAQGRMAEARQEICDLGADADNVDEELQAIQASLALDHHSLKEPFFRWQYRTPIFLVVAIAMFNQLSGINAVLYYAPAVFQMAGAPRNAAMLQTVAIGGTMLIFVVLAMLVIDHFGRRNLMIVGSLGYILSLGTTAWAFYTYAHRSPPPRRRSRRTSRFRRTWRPPWAPAAPSCW